MNPKSASFYWRAAAFCIGGCLFSPSVFPQGALTPTGAPTPTMKSLDQIDAKLEKRTPISSLPFTISTAGSYYFTSNLQFSAASGDAIIITASNVTVDLMGFTLSSTAGVTGKAIRINSSLHGIAIRNGAIAGTTTVSVSGSAPDRTWTITPGGFDSGISVLGVPEPSGCEFGHLRISGCRTVGLFAGDSSTVDHVTATQNGNTGINADTGVVTNSTAVLNGSVGITADAISNCVAQSNQSTGISATGGSTINSIAIDNGGSGIGGTNGSVTNCSAISNDGSGIFGGGSCITNSSAVGNGSDGISSNGVVAFCRAGNNNQKNDGSLDIDAGGAGCAGRSKRALA